MLSELSEFVSNTGSTTAKGFQTWNDKDNIVSSSYSLSDLDVDFVQGMFCLFSSSLSKNVRLNLNMFFGVPLFPSVLSNPSLFSFFYASIITLPITSSKLHDSSKACLYIQP